MDFRKGTYISQIYADALKEACIKWSIMLHITDIKYLTKRKKKKIEQELSNPENLPVPIVGLSNIWCIDALSGKNFALINIVKTMQ
jgi:hypothetical protein